MSKPIFLVYPPRSGSTLLQLVLNAHPAISITPEVSVARNVARDFGPEEIITGERMVHLRHIVEKDPRLRRWPVDVSRYRQIVACYERTTARDAITDLMRYYRDQANPTAEHLGIKFGGLLWYVDWLKAVFPDSRFIFIYRDGRASVHSTVKKLGSNIRQAALIWRRSMKLARRLGQQYPQDAISVRYETFVRQPEETCRTLCRFLGVGYAPEMLTYYQDNRNHEQILRGHEDKHAHTSEPITTAYLDTWKQAIKPVEVGFIEAVAGGELQRAGYELLNPHIALRMRVACGYYALRDDYWWLVGANRGSNRRYREDTA